MADARLPHSLRLSIFVLRLALGLNFFYVGWSAVFNPPLGRELGSRSLSDLYAWTGTAFAGTPLHSVFGWAFLSIGALLIVGLFTRLASIIGIAVTLASYAPGITIFPFDIAQFANDAVLATAAFLVLIFANAGSYIGFDSFFHLHIGKRHK